MAILEAYHLQVHCSADGCKENADFGGGISSNGGGVKRVRDAARRAGWTLIFQPEEKAYCPKHAPEND